MPTVRTSIRRDRRPPDAPRLLNTVQKGLKLVANRSLSLPHYLNLTFSFLIYRLPFRFAPLPPYLLVFHFLRFTENSTNWIYIYIYIFLLVFKLVVRLHANDARSMDPFRDRVRARATRVTLVERSEIDRHTSTGPR